MIMNRYIILAAGALMILAGPALAAGDVAAGKAKAAQCAGCHGKMGEGNKANPPLAGMDAAAHVKAMMDYKSGARKHMMMERFAKKLSDADIANIAAYYASLK